MFVPCQVQPRDLIQPASRNLGNFQCGGHVGHVSALEKDKNRQCLVTTSLMPFMPLFRFGRFSRATAFNQPLNAWDTAKIKRMSNMSNGATSFNQDLDNWTTSKVERMNNMFSRASSFNGKISSWDTAKVRDG